jgi:hypothetical protein
MGPKRNRGRLLGVLGVLVVIVSSGQGQSNNNATARFYAQTSAQQIISEAGASRCQFCHPSQVEGYARSAMAHSHALPLGLAGEPRLEIGLLVLFRAMRGPLR